MKNATTHRNPKAWHRHAKTASAILAVAFLGTGCNGHPTAHGTGATAATDPVAATVADSAGINNAHIGPSTAAPDMGGNLGGRAGVLINPSNNQMVFLYYDLAGIPPPIDQWVEQDPRVQSAPGTNKAALRIQVKTELQVGLTAGRGVGVVHLTTSANISQYDPSYGEFTVGALSPASEYTFDALNQHVTVKLDNGLAAQTWSVPKDKAQAITDLLGGANPVLDVVLKITKVLPDMQGGTLVTHVQSWTLRDASHGTTFARVDIPAK